MTIGTTIPDKNGQTDTEKIRPISHAKAAFSHQRAYHHLTGPCAAVTALRGEMLLLDNDVVDSVLATIYISKLRRDSVLPRYQTI